METPYSIESGNGAQGIRMGLIPGQYVVAESHLVSAGNKEWTIKGGPFCNYVEAQIFLREENAAYRKGN